MLFIGRDPRKMLPDHEFHFTDTKNPIEGSDQIDCIYAPNRLRDQINNNNNKQIESGKLQKRLILEVAHD